MWQAWNKDRFSKPITNLNLEISTSPNFMYICLTHIEQCDKMNNLPEENHVQKKVTCLLYAISVFLV